MASPGDRGGGYAPAIDWSRFRMLPDLPPYRQIAAYLKVHFSLGKIPSGARMPDPRALAYRLNAPRAEVRRAYEELAERGYVSPSRGDAWVAAGGAAAIGDEGFAAGIVERFRDLVLQARRAGLARAEIRRMVDGLLRRS